MNKNRVQSPREQDNSEPSRPKNRRRCQAERHFRRRGEQLPVAKGAPPNEFSTAFPGITRENRGSAYIKFFTVEKPESFPQYTVEALSIGIQGF